jgi:hypothetical protein
MRLKRIWTFVQGPFKVKLQSTAISKWIPFGVLDIIAKNGEASK